MVSVAEDLPVAVDPENANVRTVSASTQAFALNVVDGKNPVCSGFTMPLEVTFRKFEVVVQ